MKQLKTTPQKNQTKEDDDFRVNFAESVSELVDIKGSFFLYTLLIICFCLGVTIYAITILDNWFAQSIFGLFGIPLAIIGGFISSVCIILATLKSCLTTVSHYVFISYNKILLDEIKKMKSNDSTASLRSSTEILKEYIKDVVAPVLAGIICVFIPIIGGFIIGRIEKSITQIANKLATTISSKTADIDNKEEEYLATIEIVNERESKITPKIHATFLGLIIPFAIASALYVSFGVLSFIFFY